MEERGKSRVLGTSRKVKNLHGQFSFRNVLWVDRNGGNQHHLQSSLWTCFSCFASAPKKSSNLGEFNSIKERTNWRLSEKLPLLIFKATGSWWDEQKIISNIWKRENESISRYYRKSVMETVMVQLMLVCFVTDPNFQVTLCPLKILVLST